MVLCCTTKVTLRNRIPFLFFNRLGRYWFQSYKTSNLSNWTWINSLGYTLWNGIGLGFEFGLRDNKQEALNFALNGPTPDAGATFDNVDNELQTYWLFGLNYAF